MRKFIQLTLSLVMLMLTSTASAWKFTVNSPAEGKVEQLYQIVLDNPAGTMFVDEMGAMPCTLKCSDGTTYTYNMGDNFLAQVAGTPLGSAEIVAPGTYVLTIPAGTFHINGEGNEEQSFTWTIGDGDKEEGEEKGEEQGAIQVIWPVANQLIASIAQSGTLCKFTTSKDYAQVTIQLKNDNEMWAPHDLQVRMYDNVAKDIVHNVTTAVPNEKSFKLFKGDSYTLIIKGFVNMWDVMPDKYDCKVEIPVLGDGVEHEALSAVKLVKMTPEGTPLNPGKLPVNGGKVTLEFDGAVKSVRAANARGMEGSTIYQGTVVTGTDGRIWEILFGDLSSLASAETQSSIFNLDITAKAEDGTVVFDETKDDFRLEASWTLVEGEPEPVKVLGDPVFSIVNESEVEASAMMSVSIDFPNYEGYEGMGFKVYGQLFDKDFNAVNVVTADNNFGIFGSQAATVVFATEPSNTYSLAITKVVIYDMTTAEVAETIGQLNYNVNFTTKKAEETSVKMIPAEENAGQGGLRSQHGKILKHNRIVIYRNGKRYNVNGVRIGN